ncbi:hypothetical protein HK101_001736 [Irineochytrium annulatum]|nr:hypothetical protein HK101_001736 [Irineochytrium annulatum]
MNDSSMNIESKKRKLGGDAGDPAPSRKRIASTAEADASDSLPIPITSIPPSTTTLLSPGVLLLRSFLSSDSQLTLLNICISPPISITDPRHGAKNEKCRHLHMMTLSGKDSGCVPELFIKVKREALERCEAAAKGKAKAKDYAVGPSGRDGESVVVWYKDKRSALGLHDERGRKGCVVSVSIGDDAIFIMRGSWGKRSWEKRVTLSSGDVLVFGGQARAMVHGVEKIIPGTAPTDIQGVIAGRINLNFREK